MSEEYKSIDDAIKEALKNAPKVKEVEGYTIPELEKIVNESWEYVDFSKEPSPEDLDLRKIKIRILKKELEKR